VTISFENKKADQFWQKKTKTFLCLIETIPAYQNAITVFKLKV